MKPSLDRTGSRFPAATVASVWEALEAPVPWEQLLAWPPDVFALTDLLLVQTEAHRFVASPPAGGAWPPDDRWCASVRATGMEWSEAVRLGERPRSSILVDRWTTLSAAREIPLAHLSRGDPWNVCEAILTLHAAADEACSSLHELGDTSAFADRAWALLESEGSLSRLPSSQVTVLPKTHVPSVGITVRSLARYLSAHTSPVEVIWSREMFPAHPPGATTEETPRILLLPWPLTVEPSDFRPVRGPSQVQDEDFGFFGYDPHVPLDLDYVRGALDAAQTEGGAAAVVLPESSVDEREIPALERMAADAGVISLTAGVRGEPDAVTGLRRNYAHIGFRAGGDWVRYEQDKHHRWLLDARQIRQYHLESQLDPQKRWWEAITVSPHRIQIVDLGGGVITAAVICEDLARVDDVADVIRHIGPTTLFALLLDGPQIASRWSSRYSSVFADDPGSTVIAMTSLGMAARSRPDGTTPSRSIALWKDAERGLKEIHLSPDADAVLLIASEHRETAWTVDGRRHADATPRLVLEEIRQLHS